MAENITSAKATAKMVRVPARKVRLVLDAIRGKSVAEAFAILKFTSRGAASDVEKVLNYMYKDATIYLDRKYNKYNEFISYFYSRVIPKGIA